VEVVEHSQHVQLEHNLADKAAVWTAQEEMEQVEEKWRRYKWEECRQRGMKDQTVMDLMSQALCHMCQSIILAY